MASVLGERGAHGARLDLRLELGDQRRMAFRLSVHRVLEPLEELLEVRHSLFEDAQALLWGISAASRSIAERGKAPELADACAQSGAVVVASHRRPRCGG